MGQILQSCDKSLRQNQVKTKYEDTSLQDIAKFELGADRKTLFSAKTQKPVNHHRIYRLGLVLTCCPLCLHFPNCAGAAQFQRLFGKT